MARLKKRLAARSKRQQTQAQPQPQPEVRQPQTSILPAGLEEDREALQQVSNLFLRGSRASVRPQGRGRVQSQPQAQPQTQAQSEVRQPQTTVLSAAEMEEAWAAAQSLPSCESAYEALQLVSNMFQRGSGASAQPQRLAEAQERLALYRRQAQPLLDAQPPITVQPLGTIPLLGGTWDFLEMSAHLDALLPPEHAKSKHADSGSSGALCREMLLQMGEHCTGHIPSADAGATKSELERLLGGMFSGINTVMERLPDRWAIVRLLDRVAALGSTTFFNSLAAAIWQHLESRPQPWLLPGSRQGRPVTSVSLSLCPARVLKDPDRAGEVALVFGGESKRNQRQERDEFVLTGFVDRASGLPVFLQDIARLDPDDPARPRSAQLVDLLAQAAPGLRKAFPQVRHLVVDSALCTAKFIQAARSAGLQVVSKLSAAQVTKYLDSHVPDPAAYVDLAGSADEGDGQSGTGTIRAQWCQELTIGKERVRGLLVEDGTKTDKRRAGSHTLVVSTDLEYAWTMEELWQTCRGPAQTRSIWAVLDRPVRVAAAFVQTPARQKALVSLVALFALLLKFTEEQARDSLVRQGLLLPTIDGMALARPTLQRLLIHTRLQKMAVFRQAGHVVHVKANPLYRQLLAGMGELWLRYLEPEGAEPTQTPAPQTSEQQS